MELARAYGLTMSLNRDSPDNLVTTSYRKVMLRAHPDKPGGSQDHAQRLNDAHDKWNEARKTNRKGMPAKSDGISGSRG